MIPTIKPYRFPRPKIFNAYKNLFPGGGELPTISPRQWLQRDVTEPPTTKAARRNAQETGFAQRQSDNTWDIVNTVGSFTPAWPLFAANQMGKSIDKGEYGQAGIEGAMIAAPYAIGKGVQAALPYVKKALNTTIDAVQNPSKYHTLGFQTSPEKWYRQVGESGFGLSGIKPPEDLLDKTNRVLSKQGKITITPEEWEKMSGVKKTFVTGQQLKEHDSNYFKKGKLWYGSETNRPKYLYEAKFGDEGFLPELNNKRFRTFERSSNVGVLKDSEDLLSPENYNMYIKDWLRGYKQIKPNK